MGDKKPQRRIFVNDVDKYSSKNIAEFLSACRDEEEASEDGDAEATSPGGGSDVAFQVVGTVSASSGEDGSAEFLHQKYTSPPRDELLPLLLDCDVVIYNVSEGATPQQIDEATWALTALHAQMDNFQSRKTFVLVSSVMTWATTKPQNPDDPDAPLTEEVFRRRRPHPSFRNHHNLEKTVLKLARGKKSKLNGYVIASGLQYGRGENLFHYFFKVSWLMETDKIPVFGDGRNHLPMIHVSDLAGVIQNVIEVKPKSKYILAVDDSKSTFEEVVRKISDLLGPEQTGSLAADGPCAKAAYKPEELDCLTVDLRLDPFVLKDSFKLQWVSEAGLVDNMEKVIEEYKNIRQLLPVKICLIGPPAVGKSTVAEKLCHHYRINHITPNDVVKEKIAGLEKIVSGTDPESKDGAAAAQKQLENIERSPVADELLWEMLLEKLKSRRCQNRGFVLDGFPRTYKEAQQVFYEEDKENTELDFRAPAYNKRIAPEHVFALEATEDFLKQRVQALPESEAERRRYSQAEFPSRLAKYRELSGSEDSPLIYFDELEIHPEHIEVTTDDLDYADVIGKIKEIVGAPKTYGPTRQEQELEDHRTESERRERLAAEASERRSRNQEQLAQMEAQFRGWKENLVEVKRQEEELLEAHALPLRSYLMRHVMPSLSAAMADCCKVKPDDPIDFLAEHLLHNNLDEDENKLFN